MVADPSMITALRRTGQQYFEQVAERETIPIGYAYHRPQAPQLPEANFLGEVLLDPQDAPDPVAYLHDYFAQRQSRCFAWVPAAQQAPEKIAALVEPLGFVRRDLEVWYSREAVGQTVALTAGGLSMSGRGGKPAMQTPTDSTKAATRPDTADAPRVLAARAMRRAYTAVVERRAAEFPPEHRDALVEAQLDRLNDAQYDAFAAVGPNREPLGMITVYQVGQIGRICDLYVVPDARRQGIATALLDFALTTARRWALQPVVMQLTPYRQDYAARRALIERFHFAPAGVIPRFVAEDYFQAGG